MPEDPSPPEYRKYRARPRLFGGGGDDVRTPAAPPAEDDRPYTVHGGRGGGGRRLKLPAVGRPRGRISPGRVLKWVVLGVLGWTVLSLVVFLVSAFVHADDVDGGLGGGGPLPLKATTILMLGSDARPKGSKEPGAREQTSRADTILLMRVGGGHNGRLSIPRDTVVDIPGRGRQKVNAAFAFGGTQLMVETLEGFLGTDINHVLTVDFANFPGLIDAMGGVTYKGGCVVSRINGGFKNGGYTLRLKAGKTRIDGKQALALARTRKNACNPKEDDLTRARRQQKILGAMRSRLVSPFGFVRMPLVAWEAPKAVRSDMAGPSQIGLALAMATSGTAKTRVLRPTGGERLPDGGAGLTVDPARVQAAVARFLDE